MPTNRHSTMETVFGDDPIGGITNGFNRFAKGVGDFTEKHPQFSSVVAGGITFFASWGLMSKALSNTAMGKLPYVGGLLSFVTSGLGALTLGAGVGDMVGNTGSLMERLEKTGSNYVDGAYYVADKFGEAAAFVEEKLLGDASPVPGASDPALVDAGSVPADPAPAGADPALHGPPAPPRAAAPKPG